jgi:hypothetical protein
MKRRQLALTKVPEIPGVHIADDGVDRFEQFDTFLRDLRAHHSPIAAFATTRDESAAFQPIEQARDVGVAADETFTDVATPQAIRFSVPQRLQDAVLDQRQLKRPQGFAESAGEHFGNAQDAEEYVLLGRPAVPEGLVCGAHVFNLFVHNDNCQGG